MVSFGRHFGLRVLVYSSFALVFWRSPRRAGRNRNNRLPPTARRTGRGRARRQRVTDHQARAVQNRS